MKVFASDFDGTLFFEDHFKDEDAQAIKEFQKNGNIFGLCTGRPLIGITAVSHGEVNYDFYIISSGALILDKDLNEIYKNCISHDLTKQVYLDFKDDCNVLIQANRKLYSFKKTEDIRVDLCVLDDIDDLDGDIYGLSLQAKDNDKAKIITDKINEKFTELEAFQNRNFVDVCERGCSKGSGIQVLKEQLKIKDIAGMGDSFNDIPLLDAVDTSFTFCNSPEIVQQHADHIVNSIKEALDIYK